MNFSFNRKLNKADIRKREIIKKYPKLFAQKNNSLKETCMVWGIAVGYGWLDIIEDLCYTIQDYIDSNDREQIEFTQIKEKYGTLRIYTNYYEDYINGMIRFAEGISSRVCEKCGSREKVTQNEEGYILTLCNKCREERNDN